MPTLKLMVADSDLQSCRHLLGLLSYYPNLQLQSCCHDYEELLQQCKEPPDLIFLDMHLPGLPDEQLLFSDKTPYQPPLLIAQSHREQDAYLAVESYAFNFLLKPVSRLHLARTLMNAHSLLRQQPEQSYSPYPAKLKFHNGHSMLSLDEPGVLMIQSAGNYLCIHTTDGNHVVRDTLKAILPRLPKCFVQIHRSTLVNLHHLKQLSLQRGVYLLELTDHSLVPVSRRFKRELQSLLRDYLI